jgi:HSP20 family molecular chaperone IbpA
VWETASNEKGFDLRVEVPGVDKEGVSLTLDVDTLTIEATRSDSLPAGCRVLQKGLPTENYRLKLQLVTPDDPDGVKAQVENGILRIHLPLAPTSRPRSISIN